MKIYTIYAHKVLKSCKSKMATLEHDVCDVHGSSLLYIKTCWQILYRVIPTGGGGCGEEGGGRAVKRCIFMAKTFD